MPHSWRTWPNASLSSTTQWPTCAPKLQYDGRDTTRATPESNCGWAELLLSTVQSTNNRHYTDCMIVLQHSRWHLLAMCLLGDTLLSSQRHYLHEWWNNNHLSFPYTSRSTGKLQIDLCEHSGVAGFVHGTHHFNGWFPHEPGLAVAAWFSSFSISKAKVLKITVRGYSHVRCHSACLVLC